ncbi:MAG: polysaccharide biosynthesis protein [Owenweeksia sp.]|nr:polysaccharide biosynthesis protein [Owenweeksia sp.]
MCAVINRGFITRFGNVLGSNGSVIPCLKSRLTAVVLLPLRIRRSPAIL